MRLGEAPRHCGFPQGSFSTSAFLPGRISGPADPSPFLPSRPARRCLGKGPRPGAGPPSRPWLVALPRVLPGPSACLQVPEEQPQKLREAFVD
jgi:hypothetical protein